MSLLKPRERTMIGLGVAVALTMGVYLYLVEPLVNRAREAESLVPVREAALERRRLLVAQRPRLAEELETATRRLESESARLLSGPTAPLAASELQKLVKDMATGTNVEVRSERVLPVAERDGIQEVPIEMTIIGSIRDTMAVLSRIEHANRLLALKDLKIRVVGPGQARDVTTTLTVAGYLLPRGTPSRLKATPAVKEDG
jgi:type II secretory pathway component PulM